MKRVRSGSATSTLDRRKTHTVPSAAAFLWRPMASCVATGTRRYPAAAVRAIPTPIEAPKPGRPGAADRPVRAPTWRAHGAMSRANATGAGAVGSPAEGLEAFDAFLGVRSRSLGLSGMAFQGRLEHSMWNGSRQCHIHVVAPDRRGLIPVLRLQPDGHARPGPLSPFGRLTFRPAAKSGCWMAGRLPGWVSALPLTRPAIEAYQTRADSRNDGACTRRQPVLPEAGRTGRMVCSTALPTCHGCLFTWPRDLRRNDPRTRRRAAERDRPDRDARHVRHQRRTEAGLFHRGRSRKPPVDFFHHGMALFTRPGERVVIVFPGERPGSVGRSIGPRGRSAWAPSRASPRRTCRFEALVALLRAERLRRLCSVHLSGCWRRPGFPPATAAPGIAIRAALVSSDNIPRALRRSLGSLWGCEVFAHWGMTETGLGGALDCRFHAGLHVRESDLYVEVIDPATGAPVRRGAYPARGARHRFRGFRRDIAESGTG